MPHKYTASDQVRFLCEYFESWSDYQRDDFLPMLVNALKASSADHVNGITNNVSDMKLNGGRRPSLFDCQVKLFHEWFHVFTDDEKSKFVDHIKEFDEEYYDKLMKTKDPNNVESTDEEKANVADQSFTSANGATTIKIDDSSASSSPMSSISSQPISPQGSDIEAKSTSIVAVSEKPVVSPPVNINVIKDESLTGVSNVSVGTPTSSSSTCITINQESPEKTKSTEASDKKDIPSALEDNQEENVQLIEISQL